ncbi:MAG TPA: DNA integrity scanning diadenylate cyclase DisA [Negativicutes bacterium]|nr:DNA integrity scanning diadenylate cyclase DisA [Negativicutes bacterium]
MTTKTQDAKLWDARFVKMLKKLAPGTALREGLENILRAKMGALALIDDSPDSLRIVDCGFTLNAEYSPSNFYELAKMDGALILSSDGKKILYANAQLVPDSSIPTAETGTRHRTAERAAKQTGALVVAISHRRNIITMYLGNLRYTLKDITFILARANQALHTLERYKQALTKSLANLNVLELDELVTLSDVVDVLIKGERVSRIALEIEQNVIELGSEGRLVGMQMEEIMPNSIGVWDLIQDYCVEPEVKNHEAVMAQLKTMSEDSLERYGIGRLLGYGITPSTLDVPVIPRGYRILRQIPRLPNLVVENIVSHFQTISHIYNATPAELDEVEGVGGARARTIKEGIKRLREQTLFDNGV